MPYESEKAEQEDKASFIEAMKKLSEPDRRDPAMGDCHCPHCGRCPTCGRPYNDHFTPWQWPVTPAPWWGEWKVCY